MFSALSRERLTRYFRERLLRLTFQVFSTRRPPPAAGTVRVHLGAGEVFIPGYINVDARNLANIHLVKESLQLNEFADASIGEIYACHVLEHVSHLELDSLLSHFRRKLCRGGVLRLSVPNFETLVEAYVKGGKDLKPIFRALMGGQEYKTNFHYSVFDERFLSEVLKRNGYGRIKLWTTREIFGKSIGDWSDREIAYAGGQIPVSLNLEAMSE